MANVSLPRPDLEAHRNSIMLPIPELIRTLTSIIGKKLTSFVAGVDDTEIIESWMGGEPPSSDPEKRLRLTYQIVMTLIAKDSPAVPVHSEPHQSARSAKNLPDRCGLDQGAGSHPTQIQGYLREMPDTGARRRQSPHPRPGRWKAR